MAIDNRIMTVVATRIWKADPKLIKKDTVLDLGNLFALYLSLKAFTDTLESLLYKKVAPRGFSTVSVIN